MVFLPVGGSARVAFLGRVAPPVNHHRHSPRGSHAENVLTSNGRDSSTAARTSVAMCGPR